MEGAIESALDAGFVAGEVGEGVPAAAIVLKYMGKAVLSGQAAVVPVQVFLFVDEAEREETGFERAEAGETPGGHRDLLDQLGFEGADGLKVIEEGAEGLVEGVPVLAGDNGLLGGEAMFERVEAGGGLALGGFGAGAALGVGTVGIDLLLRSHIGV